MMNRTYEFRLHGIVRRSVSFVVLKAPFAGSCKMRSAERACTTQVAGKAAPKGRIFRLR
jgi:hypothetical protein